MRSPALSQIFKHGTLRDSITNILLRAGFGHATSNDIGDDIAGLNDSKQQLADFTKSADGIKIGFSKCTNSGGNERSVGGKSDMPHTPGCLIKPPNRKKVALPKA